MTPTSPPAVQAGPIEEEQDGHDARLVEQHTHVQPHAKPAGQAVEQVGTCSTNSGPGKMVKILLNSPSCIHTTEIYFFKKIRPLILSPLFAASGVSQGCALHGFSYTASCTKHKLLGSPYYSPC